MERGAPARYNSLITNHKEAVMKKSKTVLLVAVVLALILVAGICSMGIFYQTTTDNAENLYSQIDNQKIAPITPHGGMN